MATKKLVTRARVEGLVIVAFALVYLWQADQIPNLFEVQGVPGPSVFPTLAGAVFCLAGLLRLLIGRSEPQQDPEGGEPEAAERHGGLSRRAKFYATWAVLLGYMAAMPHVGFPVATVVALALLFALLGERRWLVAGGLAIATTAALWAGFAGGLAVKLPPGVLEPLFP